MSRETYFFYSLKDDHVDFKSIIEIKEELEEIDEYIEHLTEKKKLTPFTEADFGDKYISDMVKSSLGLSLIIAIFGMLFIKQGFNLFLLVAIFIASLIYFYIDAKNGSESNERHYYYHIRPLQKKITEAEIRKEKLEKTLKEKET